MKAKTPMTNYYAPTRLASSRDPADDEKGERQRRKDAWGPENKPPVACREGSLFRALSRRRRYPPQQHRQEHDYELRDANQNGDDQARNRWRSQGKGRLGETSRAPG